MDEPAAAATLRGVIAERESRRWRSPPSRFAWFALGVGTGIVATVCASWVGVRFPLGLGHSALPEMQRLTAGMGYNEVVAVLGSADGTIAGAELAAFDRNVCRFCPQQMPYEQIESAGGRFAFWLSRSNGLLVFNVVAFDSRDRVVYTASAYDTDMGTE